MLKNKIIATDIDDSVLNCADVLQRFIEEKYGLFSTERLKDHHNIPKLFNLDMERTLEIVADFHRSHHMEFMEPVAGAHTVLPELYRAGYRFVAITACLDEIATVERRKRNLTDVFGFEWDAIHCIGMVRSKKEALSKYEPSIWVDDLFHHAADGADIGHKAFLLDRPYNRDQHHPNVKRVVDWNHIMAEIQIMERLG